MFPAVDCLLTVLSPSVWAVRSLSSSLKEVLSSFFPPEPSLKQNVGFRTIWEEWEELGARLSNSFWLVGDLSSNARAPNVRTADPICTTDLRSKGLVCHSRSDLGKVDRHHHHAHTPRTATCIPSYFFRTRCPDSLEVSDECELHNICPSVLSRKLR